MGASLESVPEADVAIATLWVTAYAVAHFPHAKRKFYLVQDFEPMFYPASTLYALTEESYRLGLYGLCNTDNLRQIYDGDYGGKGMSFTPAVDPTVFHARGRVERMPEDPATVFVYARPGHWRNCWELASLALEELKDRLGDRVRIVTAGSWAVPEGGFGGMHHYGLLDYRATGELYRTVRRRAGAHGQQAPVVPAARADGLRRAGRRLRQPLGPLGPRGRREQPAGQAHRRRRWSTASSARSSTTSCGSGCAPARSRRSPTGTARWHAGAVRHLPLPLQPRGAVGGAAGRSSRAGPRPPHTVARRPSTSSPWSRHGRRSDAPARPRPPHLARPPGGQRRPGRGAGHLRRAGVREPAVVSSRPTGGEVAGIPSNGLLSTISVVFGAVLIASAFAPRATSSTVATVVGALFVVAGFANLLVLETSANVLGFELSNVIFALGSGLALLVLGLYGRGSRALDDDNPYRLKAEATAAARREAAAKRDQARSVRVREQAQRRAERR